MRSKKKRNIDWQKHDSKYLRRYSREHVLYEVGMFFQLGRLLMTGPFLATPPEAAVVMHNAALEAFAIHLRNLLDFFYTQKRFRTDVTAAMFYDAGELPADFPAKSSMLITAHSRAHKELCHLTTERHPEGSLEKDWKLHLLMMEMKQLFEKFLETASTARLDPEFMEHTRKLLTLR
jgi:hypothetical protein